MPSGKAEDVGHDLQKGLLHTTIIDGQSCGGVWGHLHLPRRGASAMLGQALHRLTPGASLPNGPIYRCFIMENNEIKRRIQELLQKGHIRPSSSSYGSPIMLEENKDGTWRLCSDYKALNKITIWNRYPIPRIGDLLDQLKGGNISTRSTWSLNITRYQSNPLMCGRLPTKPRRAFSNGWLCLSSWRMFLQPSWG